MIRGMHHTAISTGNLERALAFYRESAGCSHRPLVPSREFALRVHRCKDQDVASSSCPAEFVSKWMAFFPAASKELQSCEFVQHSLSPLLATLTAM